MDRVTQTLSDTEGTHSRASSMPSTALSLLRASRPSCCEPSRTTEMPSTEKPGKAFLHLTLHRARVPQSSLQVSIKENEVEQKEVTGRKAKCPHGL